MWVASSSRVGEVSPGVIRVVERMELKEVERAEEVWLVGHGEWEAGDGCGDIAYTVAWFVVCICSLMG